jgi:hypothetical protein
MAKGTEADQTGMLKKMLVPTAMGVVGSALAVVLTRKPKKLGEILPKVRETMPDVPSGGVGEITDDLRGRLDSVLGRTDPDDQLDGFESQTPQKLDTARFEQRRNERAKRREQRRRRAA